jgi:hypothetical protein
VDTAENLRREPRLSNMKDVLAIGCGPFSPIESEMMRRWERLTGCLTPVFTGERRDIDLHGWGDFPGFGCAKFTEGTMKAFMPASSQSGPAPASEGSFDMQSGGIAEYLRRFFTELEQLKHRKNYYVSHAISFRDGRLFVLISRGDCRERVYVEVLDENAVAGKDTQRRRHRLTAFETEFSKLGIFSTHLATKVCGHIFRSQRVFRRTLWTFAK